MSLKAIASLLGLSVTTVSRALNGYEDVAQETRQRVEEEARRRGYRPNAAARHLKTGRANAVGLVYPVSAPPLSDGFFSEILLTLDQCLSRHEIDLLLLANKPKESQPTLTRMLRSRAVDAIIVTHTTPQDPRLLQLQQKGFNFLAMGRSDLPQTYAWFDVDNYAGSQLAVNHCLKNNLQQIAWLGGNEPCTFVRDRRRGLFGCSGPDSTVCYGCGCAFAAMRLSANLRLAGARQAATGHHYRLQSTCGRRGDGAPASGPFAGRQCRHVDCLGWSAA